jgi:hypothetical protein
VAGRIRATEKPSDAVHLALSHISTETLQDAIKEVGLDVNIEKS